MTRPSLRWPLLLALGAAACQRPAPPSETPSEVSQAPEPPSEDTAPTPAVDPTHPLELVPARARMMLMARSPQRLAEMFERERLAGRYPDLYEELTSEFKGELGDLLDPSQLPAVGVDPTGPLGIAVLSLEDEAFVVFGRCSDPERMHDVLRRTAGESLAERTVGDARILQVNRQSAVIRHGMFAFVVVDRQRDGQPDYAGEVARIDPAQSLAHAFAMERGHAGLPAEADLQGLLDVAGIVHDEMSREQRSEQESIGRAHQRLAEARQRGATAEELDSLQRDIHNEQSFATTRRRQRQITEMFLSRTLGAIEGIGMAVDHDARGFHGRIHMALTSDAVLRDLLAPQEPPAALLAVDEDPQLVISGRLDVDVATELFAQALMADRSSYSEFEEQLSRELRLDFDPTIRRELTGDVTFALTHTPAADAEARIANIEDGMSGVLAFGVRDEGAAAQLLAQFVDAWPTLSWTEVPAIDGWTVKLDDDPEQLWLGVVAGRVAIATDRSTIERLRDGTPGAVARHFAHPDPWQWLTEGPGVARLGMRHRLPLMFFLAFMGSFESFAFPDNVDFILESEFPDDDIHSIAHSKKVRRLEKQREKAHEDKSRLGRRRSDERLHRAFELARGLGITAGTIRELPSGLMMEGGHYVDGGMGRYIETIIEIERARDAPTSVDDELAKVQRRIDDLGERVVSARRDQLQRALKKQAQR